MILGNVDAAIVFLGFNPNSLKTELEAYLCLLFLPLLFHLIESLQHPAKVSNTKLQADSFIILLGCTDEQLPELRINFSLLFRWELLLSGDNAVKIIIIIIMMRLSFCLQVNG